MLEPVINSFRKNVVSWTRKTTVQVRDSISDIDWKRFDAPMTRARVTIVDNISVLGSSIQSRLGR